MELKKCERCGCFHVSESSVCQGCVKKDSADMLKLAHKNYINCQL